MPFPSTSIEGHEQWVELRAVVQPSGSKYYFLHENRCRGIVATLPYRILEDNSIEIGLISEITPCWREDPVVCSITGGIDHGDTAPLTSVKELFEETGLLAPVESLIPLGSCFSSKAVDTVYTLFAVDVTRVEKIKQTEIRIEFNFIPLERRFYANIEDPIVHVLINRLLDKLSVVNKLK